VREHACCPSCDDKRISSSTAESTSSGRPQPFWTARYNQRMLHDVLTSITNALAISQTQRDRTIQYGICSDNLENNDTLPGIRLLRSKPPRSWIDKYHAFKIDLALTWVASIGHCSIPSMATPHTEFFSKPAHHKPSRKPILRPIFTPRQSVTSCGGPQSSSVTTCGEMLDKCNITQG
jgi:hypothetical protein